MHIDGELRPTHKFPSCNLNAHMKCGIIDHITNQFVCKGYTEIVDSDGTNKVNSITWENDNKRSGHTIEKDNIDAMTVNMEPMTEEFTTITDIV